MLSATFAFLCAYLLGSLSGAIILCRIFRQIDIRNKGSGNAGTANAFRVLGWKLGISVLFWDIAKGGLSVLLAHQFFAPTTQKPLLVLLAGLVAVLGHVFPIFHGFRGGKGVATAGGVFLMFYPLFYPSGAWGILMAMLTSAAILVTTGYASLGNLIGALVLLAIEIIFASQSGDFGRLIPTTLIVFVLVFMHRKNIRQLLQGRENRFERAMICKKDKNKQKNIQA